MATTNITVDGKQKTLHELLCSADFAVGIHHHLTFLSVLNTILSMTAFLGNTLILAALHRESSLHPPSKLLFRCLITTDLCVGLIVQPLYVVYLMSLLNEQCNYAGYVGVALLITGDIVGSVSLLTLTAINVDRLLALSLGLRYRQVVTLKRTYVLVIAFWVVSTVATTTYIWNNLIALSYSFIIISLCLLISIFSYTKIFITFGRRQTQVHGNVQQQQHQPTQLNIARYRKAVYSALWVQLALVVCYLPYGIVSAFLTYSELSSSLFVAYHYTITLVFLNSSLNPAIYCWKIKEVRQAAKEIIRQLFCSLLS